MNVLMKASENDSCSVIHKIVPEPRSDTISKSEIKKVITKKEPPGKMHRTSKNGQ